jgi:hypothetical protein
LIFIYGFDVSKIVTMHKKLISQNYHPDWAIVMSWKNVVLHWWKGQSHEIFGPRYLHQSFPLGSLINVKSFLHVVANSLRNSEI